MADLEELLRRQQDKLRGRPLNWHDSARDYLHFTDWSFVFFTVIMWSGLAALLAINVAMLLAVIN